jgi:hypothetical protein
MNAKRNLIVSGTLFTIVLATWPVLMAIAKAPGDIGQQLQWVAGHALLFKAQFLLAFLLAPAIVYMMLAQLSKLQRADNISQRFGMVFLAAYVTLNSVAYASQAVLLPRFLAAGQTELAQAWYFASPSSVSYFINQLGYCLWGIAAIALFFETLRGQRLPGLIAAFYFLSSLLSIMAFAGLLFESKAFMRLTMTGGQVLFPVGILTVAWGLQKDPA